MKIKKTLFALGASVGMFLVAGQTLAVAVAPGSLNPNMLQTMEQNSQQMQAYMAQLAQGTLSSQDQMAMATLMQPTPGNFTMAIGGTQGNMGYRVMAGKPGLGHSGQAAWFGLMFIFTVMMVWVVLLLLIGVLWHHLKKHKHS